MWLQSHAHLMMRRVLDGVAIKAAPLDHSLWKYHKAQISRVELCFFAPQATCRVLHVFNRYCHCFKTSQAPCKPGPGDDPSVWPIACDLSCTVMRKSCGDSLSCLLGHFDPHTEKNLLPEARVVSFLHPRSQTFKYPRWKTWVLGTAGRTRNVLAWWIIFF